MVEEGGKKREVKIGREEVLQGLEVFDAASK